MMKLAERAANLLVDEVAVPDKFGDAGHPTHALWNPSDRIKADENLRAGAGGHAQETPRRVRMHRPRRRRSDARVFNAGLETRRHYVRQVGRIGEEREDQFHRERNPLASLESLCHGFDGNRYRQERAVRRTRAHQVTLEVAEGSKTGFPPDHD